ncbi:MAG: APC family permease, partial [Chloroflexota bacterium]
MSLEPDEERGPADWEEHGQPVAPHERRFLERVNPRRPGNATVRVSYPRFRGFLRRRGHLEASAEIERPRGVLGRVRRTLVGSPISSERETEERLSKKKALAVFSSDALSSVAYAPQETLVVLLTAGTAAIFWSLPISIAVVVLLAIVVTSYRQTIYAYPSGGGGYIVARANLGPLPGLVAASALMLGYILTVSVSIAAAVDELVSAVPALLAWRVALALTAVGLITLLNLRGIREAGTIFAVPTYLFLAAMYSLIAFGLYLLFAGQLVIPPPPPGARTSVDDQPLTLLLLLRAFAVGSTVMTGTEAISNGIPAFKPPESRNAARTLVIMGTILATMFLGLAVLTVGTGAIPTEDQTLVSLLAHGVFGDTALYYLAQATAVIILVLAANTAYADFPRLSSLLARDDYAPHQLAFRGERLA